MTEITLNGFLAEDFAADAPLAGPVGTAAGPMTGRAVQVADARALQAGAESEADFFAEHGFVLLPHVSAVSDWDAELHTVYLEEIAGLIRERLFPGAARRVPTLSRRAAPRPRYAGAFLCRGRPFGRRRRDRGLRP